MLKQLIQRLLDSRTTPSKAAHSAMPSSSYVTVTATAVQAWGEMAKGVATFDGFVRVSARATSSNANVRVTNDTATMFSQAEATASGQTQGVFVPVAKGDSWSVFATNRDNPVVRVVKAIGGGYQALKNALLQGGVLCRLSRLYSSLRRSSLLVRRHGSATSLKPSYQGARKSPLPLTPILKTTQRRATELYVSILMALRGQSSALLLITGGAYFTARTKQEFIKCSRFLSQRVKRSALISQRIKAPLISSSFRPSVLNEVKGGASC